MQELDQQTFYRKFGVRTMGQLTTPRAVPLENWLNPRNVVFHYIPMSSRDLGPDTSFFPVRAARLKPYLLTVDAMLGTEGTPRRRGGVNFPNLEMQFRRTHPEFRRINDLSRALMDKTTPVMVNYGLLPLLYKYPPNLMSRWYRFRNIMTTVYQTLNTLAKQSSREQYVVFQLPEQIPTRTNLNRALESFLEIQHENPELHNELSERLVDRQRQTDVIMEILNNPLYSEYPEETLPTVESFADLFGGAAAEIRAAIACNYGDGPSTFEEELAKIYPDILKDNPTLAAEAFDEGSMGFGEIHVPTVGEPISLEDMNRLTLQFFQDDQSLTIADIWQWLSDNRDASLMSALDPEVFERVNFVFVEAGKFSVLNLGVLNRLRADKDAGQQGLSASAVSRNFGVYLASLNALRSVGNPTTILETIPEGTSDSEQPIVVATTGGDDKDDIINEVVDNPAMGAVKPSEGMVLGAAGAAKPTVRSLMGKTNQQVEGPVSVSMPVEAPVESPEALVVDDTHPLQKAVAQRTQLMMEKGVMSQADRRRHLRLSEKYKEIPAPFGEKGTLADFIQIPHETVWNFQPAKLFESRHVPDKSLTESTLKTFDSLYLKEVFHRDTARMVMGLQKGPFSITGYEVESRVDALNNLNAYSIRVNPVEGAASTVQFQMPVIPPNGKYKVNGVKYYMRKQRSDKPIRKISAERVALSTYYPNKLFVDRSTKSKDDYGKWLTQGMVLNILSETSTIKKVVYGKTFRPEQKVPRTYSAIAKEFVEFEVGDMHFIFDWPNVEKHFDPKVLSSLVSQGRWPCGFKGSVMLTMDKDGNLFAGDTVLGPFAAVIGMNAADRPTESVTLSVLGETIPLGVVLCYMWGMKGLLEAIGGPDRRRVKGSKRDTTENEFEVAFEDEIWVFENTNSVRTLIWASLNQWKKIVKMTPVSDFDNKDNFFILFSQMGLNARHLRELDLIGWYFLDPISIDILTEMKEPTEIKALLVKAAQYLVTDEYPDDQSTEGALFKGYERMNGHLYRSMVSAMRQYYSNPSRSKASLDVNPYDVIMSIQQDPSVSLTEESNPLHNLKEKENVTYSGTGGRSKRAMVRRTRAFHKSDLGIRSEATVDSGDVGINMYLSPNPNLTSLYGTAQGLDPKTAGTGRLLSTAANSAPFATYDDGKRVNFISIQQDHVVQSEGTEAGPISTGGDVAMGHRTDDLFSHAARGPGKIAEKSDTHVVIQYDDPKLGQDRVEIGRRFGTVTGKCVPHSVLCHLPVGAKVKATQIVAYNTGFYELDWRDPMNVRWKTGIQSYVVVMENNDTFEDASRISRSLAKRLTSPVSHIRTILVEFTQHVHQLVKAGDMVDVEDRLCYIEEGITGENSMFDDATVENLKRLSNRAPKAKYIGKVEKVEVVYFGEKEAMSGSLQKIASKYDAERSKQVRIMESGEAKNGQIFSPARVDGQQVDIDMMAIRVFITGHNGMGDGDKLVVGNQLKSVITGTIEGVFQTEHTIFPGSAPVDLDVMFSYRGINARIVESPILMGFGGMLLEAMGRQMGALWLQGK